MWEFRKTSSALILGIFALYLIHQSLPHQHHLQDRSESHEEEAHFHYGNQDHKHHHHGQGHTHHAHQSFLSWLLENHVDDHDHHNHVDIYTTSLEPTKKEGKNTSLTGYNPTSSFLIAASVKSKPSTVCFTFPENSQGNHGQRAPPSLI